jgi:3-oxoacyl-[acyl-carrier protein] reductase
MNVFITGVSRGIGKELVKQFIDAGAHHIFAVSRSANLLSKEAVFQRSNVQLIDFDFLQDDFKALFEKTQLKVDSIDILINNAGFLVNKPFEDITNEELKKVYDVNVFAPFKLIQHLLPLLKKSSHAHIVNISSMGGVQGSSKFPGLSAYSSSKAAIASLSECLAEEFKGDHISIGAVQTEMLSEAFPGYIAPLNPKEMAEYIFKFATEGAKYFNGKIISVSSTTP